MIKNIYLNNIKKEFQSSTINQIRVQDNHKKKNDFFSDHKATIAIW